MFESGNDTFWEESHSHLPGAHAEVKALQRISTKEKHLDTDARYRAPTNMLPSKQFRMIALLKF
jgi:hypothetical protein